MYFVLVILIKTGFEQNSLLRSFFSDESSQIYQIRIAFYCLSSYEQLTYIIFSSVFIRYVEANKAFAGFRLRCLQDKKSVQSILKIADKFSAHFRFKFDFDTRCRL